MKKIHFSNKIICLFLTLTMLLSAIPVWNISASALEKGSEIYSTSQNNGTVTVSMDLYNATSISGSTATYVVDKYYYKNLSDLGTLYSVKFEVNGYVVSTNIATSDYSITNSGYRDGQLLSTNSNVYTYDTSAGSICGELPEVGQTKSFTITAAISGSSILGYYGTFPLTQSYYASVSATIVIKVIDSTAIQNAISTCNNLKSTCWTSASWSTLQTSISNAQSIGNNAEATVEQINSAASAITTAKENLIHNGSISACEYCCNGGDAPVTKPDSYKDISYGYAGVRNLYDLYLPSNTAGDVSMILYIHGGSWSFGSKEDFTQNAYDTCARYGIAAASLNYRFTSYDINAWNILDDIQNAVSHIKSFAADKGLNITKMMVYGYSAGAHLSLLYSYTRKDVSAITPVCVFDKSGPAYLPNPIYIEESSQMPMLLSCISGYYFTAATASSALAQYYLLQVSPYNYVNSYTVPTVINHGYVDSIVPFTDSVYLNQILDSYGVEHEFNIFPNSNHGLESDPDMSVAMNNSFEKYVSKYLLDTVPQQNHTYTAEIKQATCTQEGYTKYTCTDCGKYYLSDFIPATHNNGTAVKENVIPATCTTKGSYEDVVYCTVCHAEVSRTPLESDMIAHIPVTDEAVAATCNTTGLTQGSHCSVCKTVLVAQEEIPMVAHTSVTDDAVAATCTKTGLTQGSHCSVCKAVLVAQEEVPMASHTLGDWVIVDEASCTQLGLKTKTCSVCKQVIESESIAKTSHKATAGKMTPASCTENGSQSYFCKFCEKELYSLPITATGHTLGDWETVTPATFEEAGLKVQKCTVCKQVVNSEDIAKLDTAEATVKENCDIVIDETNNFILVPQGETDLAKYFDLTNCIFEYTQTQAGFGTGTTVTVKTVLGDVMEIYTVVVLGDVTGDGFVDAFDVSNASEYINNFEEPADLSYMKSLDIMEDGFLDATDLAFIISMANFE